MTAVDTILFDIDDTLCTYRRSAAEILDHSFDSTGIDPFFTVQDYFARFHEFTEADTIDELRANCFAAIATDGGYDADVGRNVAEAFAAERDHGDVVFLPGAQEALEALADHRLGIVTNGSPDMQTPKIESLGIGDHFDVVVHAGYDGPAKPSPDPFYTALDALDSAPERAVHVGNSLEADIPGAQAAGVGAIWVPDHTDATPTDYQPDYTVETLHDLIDRPWSA
ncbi:MULTISPECIES: HAD family hydrolase [unclassified Haladaptatus]|uniref:HAD family hydrolase n=1 Tax=unclassified Haladaptatus TaxID=2622732 RepID=UPI0023E89A95|nr:MULTISPECIES: HAD family hydrolase [unclassified Haladaptatus]